MTKYIIRDHCDPSDIVAECDTLQEARAELWYYDNEFTEHTWEIALKDGNETIQVPDDDTLPGEAIADKESPTLAAIPGCNSFNQEADKKKEK